MIDIYIYLYLIGWAIYKLHVLSHINRESKYYVVMYYKSNSMGFLV